MPKENYRVRHCSLGYKCNIGYHSVRRGLGYERCYCDRDNDAFGWNYKSELGIPPGYKIVTQYIGEIGAIPSLRNCRILSTSEYECKKWHFDR